MQENRAIIGRAGERSRGVQCICICAVLELYLYHICIVFVWRTGRVESIGEIPSEEDFVTGGNITGNGQYLHHSLESKNSRLLDGFLVLA